MEDSSPKRSLEPQGKYGAKVSSLGNPGMRSMQCGPEPLLPFLLALKTSVLVSVMVKGVLLSEDVSNQDKE